MWGKVTNFCVLKIRFKNSNQILNICFGRLNATNALESTPLHTAACLPNFQKEIVELLLAEGGHMDMRNVQVMIVEKESRI